MNPPSAFNIIVCCEQILKNHIFDNLVEVCAFRVPSVCSYTVSQQCAKHALCIKCVPTVLLYLNKLQKNIINAIEVARHSFWINHNIRILQTMLLIVKRVFIDD